MIKPPGAQCAPGVQSKWADGGLMRKDPFILSVAGQTYFVHSRVEGARTVKWLLLLLPMLTSVELRRFGGDGDGGDLGPDHFGRIAVRVGIERGRPAPEDGRTGEEWPVLLNISSEHLPNIGVILLELQAVPRWIEGFALRMRRLLLRLVGKLYAWSTDNPTAGWRAKRSAKARFHTLWGALCQAGTAPRLLRR